MNLKMPESFGSDLIGYAKLYSSFRPFAGAENTVQHLPDFLHDIGLDQGARKAELPVVRKHRVAGIARGYNSFYRGVELFQLFYGLPASHSAGYGEIEDRQIVGPAAGGFPLIFLDRLGPVLGGHDLVSQVLEHPDRDIPDDHFIIHQQYPQSLQGLRRTVKAPALAFFLGESRQSDLKRCALAHSGADTYPAAM